VSAARERVLRVLAVAARVARACDPLFDEARARLEATSGLSREGVALALAAHLETRADEADLDRLVARAGSAPTCHVLLSANVCTGALRAVALAVATAPRVVVRPSRRDPALGELLARELSRDPAFARLGGSITLAAELAPAPGDHVHAYGRDATLDALREHLPEGVALRAFGSGVGLAIVGPSAALDEAARDLAADVVPFDQAGCLSPRLALVEGNAARADAFAAALDLALDRAARAVPRGPLDDATLAAITLYRASIEALGGYRAGAHHGVGVDLAPRALALPPPARLVHVAPAMGDTAADLLTPWARLFTIVGATGGGALLAHAEALTPRARRARLGDMQRPPLDGPVDLRTDPLDPPRSL
jgi:hypothetical protein